MIEKYGLLSVRCDLCEKHYPGKKANPDHPVIYFPGKNEAIEAIVKDGWTVLHNQDDFCPQIVCPTCEDEMEYYNQLSQKHEKVINGSG